MSLIGKKSMLEEELINRLYELQDMDHCDKIVPMSCFHCHIGPGWQKVLTEVLTLHGVDLKKFAVALDVKFGYTEGGGSSSVSEDGFLVLVGRPCMLVHEISELAASLLPIQ